MGLRRRGFTLIELLVVIAIIAILAAILFPVFLRAKERGKEMACLSNMRQIGTAMQLYVDNWNGSYPNFTVIPGFGYTAYNSGIGGQWIQQFEHRYKDTAGKPAGIGLILQPYVKNMAVFKCPSEWKKWPAGIWRWCSYEEGSSYYLKHAIDWYSNEIKSPIKVTNVMYPSRVTMFYEEAWHSGEFQPFLWQTTYWNSLGKTPMELSINGIFIDGHVGKFKLPYNSVAGFDGNWYHIPDANGNYIQDLSKGARDIK